MKSPLVPFIGERSPRILVVDDDLINLEVLVGHLSRWHCAIETATGGAEAIAEARASGPDSILLDIVMPDQSGFDVSTILQTDPATRHIPIIFLSALRSDEAESTGLETGRPPVTISPNRSTRPNWLPGWAPSCARNLRRTR